MAVKSPIVIGTDGSAESRAALEIAADEAARSEVPLRIVHAFAWPQAYAAPELVLDPASMDHLRAEAEKLLADSAARVTDRNPGLTVSTELLTISGQRKLFQW